MKVSRTFVKWFLVFFLVAILVNIVALIFRVWNQWYLITLCLFILVLFFLIYRKKDKGVIKFFKVLMLITSLGIIIYIFYLNFIASHEFNYFYDIGSEIDSKKPYLTPITRISESDLNESYRNITSQLVYFDAYVPPRATRIFVQLKLKNVPENNTIILGAKNKKEWSYFQKQVYNPSLEKINIAKKITKINSEMPEIFSINEIPSGSIIATDLKIDSIPKKQELQIKEFEITNHLRESHNFYIYLKESLELYVEKQDLNWYEGEDVLTISLKDINGNLLGTTLIEDDGIIDKNKTIMPAKNSSLLVKNLTEGVYILELRGNADTIITKIKLNTNKIVSQRIFSADSSNYLRKEDQKTEFYTETKNNNSYIKFQTYHASHLQNISVGNQELNMEQRATKYPFKLKKGKNIITLPKSNVIIETYNYVTFKEENYFEPFEYSIIKIPSKEEDLLGIDYIITEYNSSKKENDWIILQTSFEMKDLYIDKNKLNFVINIPYLAKNETNNSYVSIDWINITIQKDGFFKKNKN